MYNFIEIICGNSNIYTTGADLGNYGWGVEFV